MELNAKRGDIIFWKGDKDFYVVLKNYGQSGAVHPLGDPETIVDPFHWNFAGNESVVVHHHDNYNS